MSEFLKAIEKIDQINCDKALKPYLVSSLNVFHTYFTENNLLDAFDLTAFFNDNIYLDQNLNNLKLTIRAVTSENENQVKYNRGVAAYYSEEQNIIVLNIPLLEAAYKIHQNRAMFTFETYLEQVLSHEILHSLTLRGSISFKKENKTITINDAGYAFCNNKLINLDCFSGTHQQRYSAFFEAKTAQMISKMYNSPRKGYYAYHTILDLIEYLHEYNGDRDFLQRNVNGYKKALTSNVFNTINENMQSIFNFSRFENVIDIYSDGFEKVINVIFENYEHKVLLSKNTNVQKFIDLQTKVKLMLPHYNVIQNLNKKLENLNYHFIDTYANKNNLQLNKQVKQELNTLLNWQIHANQENVLAKQYNYDKVICYNKHKFFVNLFIKDNKLTLSSPFYQERYVKVSPLVTINSLKDFNETEIELVNEKKLPFYQIGAFKQQNQPLYIYRDEDYKDPLKLNYQNNQISFIYNGKEEMFDLNQQLSPDFNEMFYTELQKQRYNTHSQELSKIKLLPEKTY